MIGREPVSLCGRQYTGQRCCIVQPRRLYAPDLLRMMRRLPQLTLLELHSVAHNRQNRLELKLTPYSSDIVSGATPS